MKQLYKVLVISICMMLSFHAYADNIKKLGFINTERVYREATIAQKIMDRLQQEFASRQQALTELKEKVLQLKQELKTKQLSMKQKKDKGIILEKIEKQYAQELQQYRTDLSLRRNEEFIVLQQTANDVILEIAKSKKYDLILQDVVYIDKKFDITDEVIKALNEKNE